MRRGRSRSSATTMRTGCSGSSRERLGLYGIRRRVPGREQEEERARLRRVAEGECGEVAQSSWCAAAREDREPGEERRRSGDAADGGDVPPDRVLVPARRRPRALTGRAAHEAAAERRREQEGGNGEDESKEAAPTALTDRRVDLEVDGIVRLGPEPRVWIGGEEDVRAHLCRVAQVRRDEVVQALGHLALDEHGEPVHERHDGSCDPAQRHPHEHAGWRAGVGRRR